MLDLMLMLRTFCQFCKTATAVPLLEATGARARARAFACAYLLQQGDEEVDGLGDVLHQLFLRHLDVADGDGDGQHLLHLELDGGAELLDLRLQVVFVGERGGELAGLVQAGAKHTRNLLDQRGRGQETVVLLGCTPTTTTTPIE